jgi:DNA helicase-2/ATP-dependent DNA helicase PcrA
MAVGDEDQSIYGWRGANIRNILDFEKDFKNVVSVKLEQNYRSTSIILNAANAVIKNNTGRKEKTLWTEVGKGEKITYYKGRSDYEESAYITKQIKRMLNTGVSHNEIAILYRMNALSRRIEEHFIHANLPYKIFGGVNFYSRREIKDILAYLKLINNPMDSVAAQRIINTPRRGIGDTTIQKIVEFSNETGIPFLECLREDDLIKSLGARGKRVTEFLHLMDEFIAASSDVPVPELIELIMDKTDYIGDLESNTDNYEERFDNVRELLSKAMEFMNSAEDKSLSAFLEDVSLVADIDNHNESDEAITLMTLHSSKGLEFNCVFLMAFEEGVFPGYRAVMSGDRDEIEEERRLCYVGITRAKKNLIITSASSRMLAGQTNYNQPSRFLKEIPQEYIRRENLL